MLAASVKIVFAECPHDALYIIYKGEAENVRRYDDEYDSIFSWTKEQERFFVISGECAVVLGNAE